MAPRMTRNRSVPQKYHLECRFQKLDEVLHRKHLLQLADRIELLEIRLDRLDDEQRPHNQKIRERPEHDHQTHGGQADQHDLVERVRGNRMHRFPERLSDKVARVDHQILKLLENPSAADEQIREHPDQ